MIVIYCLITFILIDFIDKIYYRIGYAAYVAIAH